MRSIPFVGRSVAVADLVAAVTGGTNVVLRGPPGIGKTRLVAEVLRVPPPSADDGPGDRHVDLLLASAATSGRALGTLAPLLPAVAAEADLAQVYALLMRY